MLGSSNGLHVRIVYRVLAIRVRRWCTRVRRTFYTATSTYLALNTLTPVRATSKDLNAAGPLELGLIASRDKLALRRQKWQTDSLLSFLSFNMIPALNKMPCYVSGRRTDLNREYVRERLALQQRCNSQGNLPFQSQRHATAYEGSFVYQLVWYRIVALIDMINKSALYMLET
jgi:hypothetical protein